jgi:uncharacterized protein
MNKPRAFNPAELDVEAFAKLAADLDGAWPLVSLERLAASVQPASADVPSQVFWQARGELRASRGAEPQIWLHLKAQAEVGMDCQRCLKPVPVPLSAERSFLFVRGEDVASELDADLEDDVLALTRSLDLRELIEDELLLALPLVPRHEVCPQPLQHVEPELEEDEAPHPFAALAALKRGGLPN